MDIDAGQATIITDRCIPPKGLASSPSTLKAVLWCLRGLGAPGNDLSVYASVIERRTCLSRRAVTRAMSCLREHGILTEIQAPSPGHATRYRMHYERLAEWMDEGDRDAARIGNGRTTGHRSSARQATDRAHHRPPTKSTGAPESRSCAPESSTVATQSTDIKEETALPAFPAAAAEERPEFLNAERELAAAAAGGRVQGVEDWEPIAKAAGLELNLAGQAAHLLVSQGITDRAFGMNALERLAERLKSKTVTNPTGLLKSILSQPAGSEPSQKSISRERQSKKRDAALVESCTKWDLDFYDAVQARVLYLLTTQLGDELTTALMPDGVFAIPLGQWPAMVRYVAQHWANIKPGLAVQS